MLLVLLNKADYEIVNIGSGTKTSLKGLVRTVGEVLGEKISIKVDPKRLRKSDRPVLHTNIAKLKRLTGWKPTVTLKDSVHELLKAR